MATLHILNVNQTEFLRCVIFLIVNCHQLSICHNSLQKNHRLHVKKLKVYQINQIKWQIQSSRPLYLKV